MLFKDEKTAGMDADEYQMLAMRTCALNHPGDQMLHGIFGLNAEAGEVAGIVQKHYQGHMIDHDHLVKECGDVLWFIAEILDSIGVSMSECMITNVEKLKKRYPKGFEAERSLHRQKGDI